MEISLLTLENPMRSTIIASVVQIPERNVQNNMPGAKLLVRTRISPSMGLDTLLKPLFTNMSKYVWTTTVRTLKPIIRGMFLSHAFIMEGIRNEISCTSVLGGTLPDCGDCLPDIGGASDGKGDDAGPATWGCDTLRGGGARGGGLTIGGTRVSHDAPFQKNQTPS
jgi:hypothetical protein